MEDKSKLKKVPIVYLWEGLVLLDNLYNFNGNVLLIPHGETLTQNRLNQLTRFNFNNMYITTYEDTYNKIMERNAIPPEARHNMTKNEYNYALLKKGVEDIFTMATHVQKLPGDAVESTVQAVDRKLADINAGVVFQYVDMPRPMDEALQRHCLNVSLLNGLMGGWMNLPKEDIKLLITIGVLHDIGKTKIPEEILNAPRKLTAEEYDTIKLHPVYSYELLGDGYDEQVKTGILLHHEKMDGTGYPKGLTGEQIPLFARITTISDIYDAMVSKRSYKEERISFDILASFSQNHFNGIDQQLAAVFIKNMRKQFLNKPVLMSDKSKGIVRYIPPNDLDHPIVEADNIVRQTDENWFCVKTTD